MFHVKQMGEKIMNLEPYFNKYQAVVDQVDAVFRKVQAEHGECVRCRVGCSDCCHALFDLTLIEAMYIKAQFDKVFKDRARALIIERANEADRAVFRLKRQAFKDHKNGKAESEILEDMAAQRIRCPLLNSEDQCDMYAHRPLTCRLYGIPTVIGDKAHSCGLSGFEQGKPYPTVKLETIQRRLYDLSAELAAEIGSSYPKLAELLVPVSMALLTEYSEEYLGVKGASTADQKGDA
jgi:Fe-S-cluster containining protein